MKLSDRFLSKFFVFVIIFRIVMFVAYNSENFTRKFDPVYFGELYSQSQYVIGERSKGGIGDDGLYAFAGYYYVFARGDISSVNFEHPPLGKYLIGLSILIFGNQNVINLFYLALLLSGIYILAKYIGLSSPGSFISVLIVASDPLFLDHLLRSQLDLPFTLFFMGAVYFFVRGLKAPARFLYSNMLWGAAFATRFFPAFVFIFLLELVFVVRRKNSIKYFLLTSAIIPIIYLITHAMFFVYHPSFAEFLQHKRWMLSWFSGTVISIGNIWRSLMTGWYTNSSGVLRQSDHWWIVVPIVIVSSILSPFVKFISRSAVWYLYLLSTLILVYLTFLSNGDQKFVMPIYPILVVLSVRTLTYLYSIILIHAKRGRSRPH